MQYILIHKTRQTIKHKRMPICQHKYKMKVYRKDLFHKLLLKFAIYKGTVTIVKTPRNQFTRHNDIAFIGNMYV